MRIRILLLVIVLLTGIAFLIFKSNEDSFIEKLIPVFPAKDENTPGYYADLITFLVTESIWVLLLVTGTIALAQWSNFSNTFRRLEDFLIRRKKNVLAFVYISFALITILIATAALEQFPNSADEYVYLFQAQQLSDGKLWDNVHPQPDFFEFHHIAQKEGKWIGRFPPGWPLVLSLAYVMHIPPFLINTILALVCLWMFHRFLGRLYDERIALWGTIFLAYSSFFIFNAASFFSHIASLLEGLVFVYLSYRYIHTEKNRYALGAGVFLGMLVMTRQLTALIFILPTLIYYIQHYRLKMIRPLFIVALGTLPFVAFFLWYNYKITGDAFVPVTMWTDADEALGFVKGHTPQQGVEFTFKRFAMFVYFASPALLILYFWFLINRLRDSRKLLSHPEDYIFLLLVIGYFFYYHSGGNQYGPRFYLEGFPFLIALVVARAFRTDHKWMKAFLICGLLYSIFKIPFVGAREHRVIDERKDIYALVEKRNIHDAVIFISSETGMIRPMPVENLDRNDRFYKNDVLYARDLGEHNLELMRYYPSKEFYIYKRKSDDPTGELEKLNKASTHAPKMSSQSLAK